MLGETSINHPPEISVIVPFKYRKGDPACLIRLSRAISCFANRNGVEVVVYDTSSLSISKRVQKNINFPGIRYFHCSESSVFSPGNTRNKAVEHALGQFLFFFDADLLCTHDFIETLFRQLDELKKIGQHGFSMYPCLYLSEIATNRIHEGKKPMFKEYIESYLKGLLNDVDGIALVSSCLLVERNWFLKIGGFNQYFVGHGCEDFELIHRLAAYFPLGSLPDDYALDFKSHFPASYVGFRRFYSYYSLPHLFEKNYLLHQWHKRPLAQKYHRQREENERFFTNTLTNISLPVLAGIYPFSSKNKLPEYEKWIINLMRNNGYDIENYPGLFRWKEGVFRPPNGFQKKMRKLVLKPRQFFLDFLKK